MNRHFRFLLYLIPDGHFIGFYPVGSGRQEVQGTLCHYQCRQIQIHSRLGHSIWPSSQLWSQSRPVGTESMVSGYGPNPGQSRPFEWLWYSLGHLSGYGTVQARGPVVAVSLWLRPLSRCRDNSLSSWTWSGPVVPTLILYFQVQ